MEDNCKLITNTSEIKRYDVIELSGEFNENKSFLINKKNFYLGFYLSKNEFIKIEKNKNLLDTNIKTIKRLDNNGIFYYVYFNENKMKGLTPFDSFNFNTDDIFILRNKESFRLNGEFKIFLKSLENEKIVNIRDYKSDLKNFINKDYDIMKIFRLFRYENTYYYKLIYFREENE